MAYADVFKWSYACACVCILNILLSVSDFCFILPFYFFGCYAEDYADLTYQL